MGGKPSKRRLVLRSARYAELSRKGIRPNHWTESFVSLDGEALQVTWMPWHFGGFSSTRSKGGTGLGLSIAKRIIEMHNGRICVESDVGKGSTFFFSLPVRVHQDEGPS